MVDLNPNQRATSANPEATEAVVQVGGVSHHYGEGELRKQVLFENILQIPRGEIVIMTGPSGSGKTTLLTLIGTLRRVQDGSLKVLGKELAHCDRQTLVKVRQQVGFIFQHHNLFASLTAQQNVGMALELAGLSPREVKERSSAMLDRLGLAHRVNYKPAALSGGQKQRVAIARGLVHKPRLVLADEPTAALDEHSGREVVTLLQQLAKQEGCTILLVTHDNRILDVADRIVNMVDGRIKSDVAVSESSLICQYLQRVPAFAKLSPRTLTEVADKMVVETAAMNTAVIRQGDVGDKFYLIRRGTVDVVVESLHRTQRVVATLGEGDTFGETALLTGEPRNATIVAREESVLYSLGKEDFIRVISDSASFEEEQRRALFDRH